MYLVAESFGTVAFDDRASVPAELGEDYETDRSTIDQSIDDAVEGRLIAFRTRRGGAIEVVGRDGRISTTYMNYVLPLPGWRKRLERVDYQPYRINPVHSRPVSGRLRARCSSRHLA